MKKQVHVPILGTFDGTVYITLNLYDNTLQINEMTYGNIKKYKENIYSGDQQIMCNDYYVNSENKKLYFINPNVYDIYNTYTQCFDEVYNNFECMFTIENIQILLTFRYGITAAIKINDKYIYFTKYQKNDKTFRLWTNDGVVMIIKYKKHKIYINYKKNIKVVKNEYVTKMVYNYNKIYKTAHE